MYIGIVKQSADFIGHAQIEIYVKKLFKGQLKKESFKIQSCQKPNENDFLIEENKFCPLKNILRGVKSTGNFLKSHKNGLIFLGNFFFEL